MAHLHLLDKHNSRSPTTTDTGATETDTTAVTTKWPFALAKKEWVMENPQLQPERVKSQAAPGKVARPYDTWRRGSGRREGDDRADVAGSLDYDFDDRA